MRSMPGGAHVHKLGDVHGAVGGRGVLDQDGRGVAPFRIDVGEEHLGVRRAALGGEHQPAAVGREAVPGVHQRRVAAHAARLPARGRHDVELAIGAHQQAVPGLHEDDPASVRRDLREAVAHAVAGGAGDGFGLAAFAVVEGDAVEIVLDRDFRGVVGVGGHFAVGRVRILRLGAREHQVLAVGAPDGVGLHVARVVGAGQRLELARVAVVPDQDAARGIKDLEEAVVREIGDVVELRCSRMPGGLTVVTTRRPSGETCDMKPTRSCAPKLPAEGGPRNHVLAADGHLRRDRRERIEALIVRGTVQIHAQSLAIVGERVAVGAGVHVRQQHAARGLRDVAQPPGDQGDGIGSRAA